MRLSPGGYLLASSGPLSDQLHDEPGASNHLAGERPTKGGGVMRLKQVARAELAEIIVEILDLAGEFDFSLVRTEEGDAYISENEINTEHFEIDLRVYTQPYAI